MFTHIIFYFDVCNKKTPAYVFKQGLGKFKLAIILLRDLIDIPLPHRITVDRVNGAEVTRVATAPPLVRRVRSIWALALLPLGGRQRRPSFVECGSAPSCALTLGPEYR